MDSDRLSLSKNDFLMKIKSQKWIHENGLNGRVEDTVNLTRDSGSVT